MITSTVSRRAAPRQLQPDGPRALGAQFFPGLVGQIPDLHPLDKVLGLDGARELIGHEILGVDVFGAGYVSGREHVPQH